MNDSELDVAPAKLAQQRSLDEVPLALVATRARVAIEQLHSQLQAAL